MNTDNSNNSINTELLLRREIEDFYLPKQLVDAIVKSGSMLGDKSKETIIAIGFLDISGYTFLSQFLSPPENQMVLNGLYSAFNWVLQKHGGYLNKIEGDSMMFHFGGPIDQNIQNMDEESSIKIIARELFYTCVELQRVCALFDENNENFLSKVSSRTTVDSVLEAYKILKELRSGYASASFNALFHIRIRVGASIGRVLIGNFGPEGAKHWDIIGMPVIEAKRMESSSPVGGLRITSDLFKILDENGIARQYYRRIKREAEALGSVYKNIKFEELFSKSKIFLKDKRNAEFDTYSIQVNPSLPESITKQSKLLLQRGETGADDIVNFIKYYRGNHFVIDSMERLFKQEGIILRKDSLFRLLFPGKYKKLLLEYDGDVLSVRNYLSGKYSLFDLFVYFGNLQDSVKPMDNRNNEKYNFSDYDKWMADRRSSIQHLYKLNKERTNQSYYFYNVIFPLFFENIKAAILEYQEKNEAAAVEEI